MDEKENQMKATSETPRVKFDILGLFAIAIGVFFLIVGLIIFFNGLYPSASIFTGGMHGPPYHPLQFCMIIGVINIIIAVVLFINGVYRIQKK
jgi:hypothetical protein